MSYFSGHYFKHENNGKTIAFIVGKSSENGKFIQVITDKKSYRFKGYGNCIFTKNGAKIDIGNSIKGVIKYGKLTPLKYDIMGPFKALEPLMECSHSIISMRHNLRGWVNLDGEFFDLDGGVGYIEGDRGRSFPKSYLWTQCNFKNDCSFSLSIAEIPFMGFKFQGCICLISHRAKEYRLATYLGVKILHCDSRQVILRQGKYLLIADISPTAGHKLAAPRNGKMNREIRECIACPLRVRFYEGGRLTFDKSSGRASFEFMS
ncbi:MAG: tocopherol cyclase family protein [Oscillospiraceae bacterium]|nr:tocopherol cyclase family protein [Oscillospiraceae bacterium]